MSIKDKFTNEEWMTLEYAPLWVLAAVGTADGKLDEKEVEAFTKELADAPLFKDELVREVMLADLMTMGNLMVSYKADSRNVQVGLGQVADVLDKKSPEHADDFKKVLLGIAAKIANASGPAFGEKISQHEKVAFGLVATFLRAKLN